MVLEDFKIITPQQWKQQVQFELDGLDYNSTLLWEFSGINVKPFYAESDKPLREIKYFEFTEPNYNSELADIISEYAKKGTWKITQKTDFQKLKNKITEKTALTINTTIYENAGANIVQQLAYALAIADEYIKFCGKKIIKNIQFKFNISSNFFFEIAKLQAIQNLWNLLLEEHQIKGNSVKILTQSSFRNKDNSETDDIRFITENLITNIPTELIKGTFYIENITAQIIEKSFVIFKLIKENGGFIKQLQKGTIQKKIKQSAKKDNFTPKIKENIRKTEIETIPSLEFRVQSSEFRVRSLEFGVESFINFQQNFNSKFLTLNSMAGFPPFLRGISATMYALNPWENIKTSDFSNEKIIISDENSDLTQILINGLQIVKKQLNNGISIDEITKNLIFSFTIKGRLFEEISKLRASRVLWSKIIKNFEPKDEKSMAMYIHCEIFGEGKSEKTINSIGAIFGGTQSLNIDKITNQYIKNEIFILKIIDPWGGSFVIENLTKKLINDTWKTISEKL